MTFSHESIAPCIFLYNNVINFSDNIIDICQQDNKNWIIRNQEATHWKLGDKILGYDEYPVNFNFSVNENFLLLGKKSFDIAKNYASVNLTNIDVFDSCILRKYSPDPAFLELESSDFDNPSRKITSILFLSDVDGGGEVKINNFNISVTPQKNTAIVFPSSYAYAFKINKPKNNNSFILVSHFS